MQRWADGGDGSAPQEVWVQEMAVLYSPCESDYRDLLHVTSRALSRPAGQVPWR